MKKVLIVEDHVLQGMAIKSLLENQGYFCEVACNKDEARTLFITFKPDLVILDIRLDEEDAKNFDGLRLGIEFSQQQPNTKFIVCSGDDYRYEKVKDNKIFKPIYLDKPINEGELLINVQNQIGPADESEEEIVINVQGGEEFVVIKGRVRNDYLVIRLKKNEIVYAANRVIYTSLPRYEQILINEKNLPLASLIPLLGLFQIHKKHAVNLDYILSYQKSESQVVLRPYANKGGTTLEVGTTFANDLMNKMTKP